MDLRDELSQRWFLNQYTHEKVFELYNKGGEILYLGVDPTADSMHLGNFVGFMHAVQRMKRRNKLILIVGGATGMIGDPGGKDSERSFLDEKTLEKNVLAITTQVETILGHLTELTGQTFVFEVKNNADFYREMSFLWFLREVGKYITVNQMITKETVKRRVEDPDKSISYTEFSYMLLQWYDFLRLFQDYGCKLQIASSDQRGNIVTGIELIKKKLDKEAYGVTCPLLTDSAGRKFGKSEGNALRLNPAKNSPYVIYQYFINTADEDIEKYFKLLTLTPFETIVHIVEKHHKQPQKRIGQELLAHAVTQTIFGAEAAHQAQLVTKCLFGENGSFEELQNMNDKELQSFYQTTGSGQIAAPSDRMIETIVAAGLAPSNAEAKKLLKDKAIFLNERQIDDVGYILTEDDFIQGKMLLLRKGKKTCSSLWRK